MDRHGAGVEGWLLDDLVRQIAAGITFGWADELAAAGDAALGFGAYETNVARERARDAAFRSSHPWSAAGAELAGGLLGAIAGVRAMPAAAGWLGARIGTGPMAERAAWSAATGGAAGALYGAGAADGDLRDRLDGAYLDGLLGLATGAVAPAILDRAARLLGGRSGAGLETAAPGVGYSRRPDAGGPYGETGGHSASGGVDPRTPAGRDPATPVDLRVLGDRESSQRWGLHVGGDGGSDPGGPSRRGGGRAEGHTTADGSILSDAEGRPLTAPIIVDNRGLNVDELQAASRTLVDIYEDVPRAEILARAGDNRPDAIFFEDVLTDESIRRRMYIAEDVFSDPLRGLMRDDPRRIVGHEGIGHPIQSWVWPERWLDDAHLAAYARSIGMEPEALAAELRAASREVRPYLARHPDQDHLYEYFPDAVQYYTYEPNYFRDEFPAVARMIRDVWNPHPKAASTIQFRTVLPWLLAAGGGAGLLEAVLRERAPGSAEAATLR